MPLDFSLTPEATQPPLLPAAPPPAPMTYRKFGDGAATRGLIYDNVLKAAQQIEPISNDRYTLQLSDVNYQDPDRYSAKERTKAILSGGTMSRRLRGTWNLLDNATGQQLASRKMVIAHVPYMTDDGTFVNRGTEYGVAHQMRLRAGVFTRRQQNGELEAHMNMLPGKGRSHHIYMDPATGVFKLKIAQAQIPLSPLLKALGASDNQLREMWGNELYQANVTKDDNVALKKIYERVVRKKDPNASNEMLRTAVADAFNKMELDPSVTRRTLQSEHTAPNLDTVLAVTKKLIALNRGEAEPDDRDSLAYQTLFGPEDLLAERLGRDRQSIRQALWKATAKGNLDKMPSGVFTPAINAVLMGSGLASPMEEINPAEILDQQTRVTRMGDGGIPSLDSVPVESRAVQPSYLGFIDFLRTPESGKTGVDARLARGAVKGSDGQLYMQVRDTQTGKMVYKSPQDLADATLAIPGQDPDLPMVVGMVNGKMEYVDRKDAQYELPRMENAFSPLANMIPMKSMTQGQRVVMGSRMLTQALPLVEPEAPLVQGALPDEDGKSFEEEYGKHMGAVRADAPARITKIDEDGIELVHQDGTRKTVELRNNMPLNRKTFWHQTPTVQVGDVVKPGQLLARSNFTDAAGTTSLGKNLRVAYLAYDGHNFEDAIVVSQSAAEKKLISEHMYQNELELTDKHKMGRHAFLASFPSKYDKKMLANFDEDGIVKVGTEVKHDDPLILAVQEKDKLYGQVHRGRGPSFTDSSITWDHKLPGVVTHVERTDKGPLVVVKSKAVLDVGDKLSGRYGDKGVVAKIVPDDQMPTDKDGRPYEILVNPLGINSRGNPSQIIESALGKIAALTGKPYKVPDFQTKHEMLQFAAAELRKHGLSSREDVIDQESGRKIPGINSGVRFFMKLHHTSESKGQGRGTGGYTSEGAPAKGGESGSKKVGMLDLGALLSHGASHVIRDIKLVRGQADPQRWSQFMSGFNPAPPKIPYMHEKFVNLLRAGGINPVREGTRTHIMAMTPKVMDQLVGDREIQNTETVDWKGGLKPKAGGLFDEKLTGGHDGNLWSSIKLHEPMPNPVMEEPIRRVLGLTEAKFRDILAGRADIAGKRGPEAVLTALQNIDVDAELTRARQDIKSGKRTSRDAAVRRLRYLKDTQRLGIHPSEWMMHKVPVLPPKFRPVTTMGSKKLPLVADANFLYKEVFDSNSVLKELSGELDDTGDERLAVYDAVKAVTGLGAPTHPKNVERNVKGALKHIFGSSPKHGMVQRKLLSTTTDLVGRAVITPNPDLDMDHVGLPEDKAWEIYKPFIVRHLTRRGMPRLQAAHALQNRTPDAKQALLATMESRPIIINRAPVLHRYGMMAFHPRLVKGHTMQISPLVVGGFSADFDGDAMQYHVPSTDEAAKEALHKMLPSANLLGAANFKPMYKPTHEYVGGLYAASARVDKKNKPKVFQTQADAVRAYHRGDINVDSEIEILDS
jgi:DNA-directed RNA polymerase subunit beta